LNMDREYSRYVVREKDVRALREELNWVDGERASTAQNAVNDA
jgi:hypothetical protein